MPNKTPHKPTIKRINSKDGLELYYEYWRGDGSKETLIFLHGLGGDSHAWFQEIPYFLSKGYSVIAPDLRGHGLSDHPKNIEGYEIEHFVSDLKAVIDEQKLRKVTLIGHCFGGMVSMLFARKYPEIVSKMILVDSSFRFPYFDNKNLANRVVRKLLRIGSHIVPGNYIRKHIESDNYKETGDFNFFRIANDILHLSIRGFMILYAETMDFSAEKWLSEISVPTLIIEATDDLIVPKSISVELQTKIKNSQLALIPYGHHIIHLSNPKDLNEEIWGFVSK